MGKDYDGQGGAPAPRGGGNHRHAAPTTRTLGVLPLCKNCVHFQPGSVGSGDICTHPDHGFDLIRGEKYLRLCTSERQNDSYGAGIVCGRSGRAFVEAPKVPA